MDVKEAIQERKNLERIQVLPPIQVENIKKASKEELAEMFLDLRLWCSQVFMELKELRQQVQERNTNDEYTGTTGSSNQ